MTCSNDFYISLEGAASELSAREAYKPTIEQWWQKNNCNPQLPNFPNLAVLARQVATFRYEDAVFHELARSAGLTPVCLELTTDKMSSESKYKKSLLQPVYFERFGRNFGMVTRRHKLASVEKWKSYKLSDVVLGCGTKLVDYHHARYDSAFGPELRSDNADWVANISGAKNYYPIFLSLFLAHAVLFEDYHGGESGDKLDALTTNIFEPTFQKLYEQFGIKPLIVPMPWAPELALYPPDTDWQEHNVIPSHILESVMVA